MFWAFAFIQKLRIDSDQCIKFSNNVLKSALGFRSIFTLFWVWFENKLYLRLPTISNNGAHDVKELDPFKAP